MNCLLAALSGTEPREMEEAAVIEKLFKDRNTPRILDKQMWDNINNAVARDYLREKQLKSREDLPYAIAVLVILMPLIFLLCFAVWVWWSLE
jgi:hypothetical protein